MDESVDNPVDELLKRHGLAAVGVRYLRECIDHRCSFSPSCIRGAAREALEAVGDLLDDGARFRRLAMHEKSNNNLNDARALLAEILR